MDIASRSLQPQAPVVLNVFIGKTNAPHLELSLTGSMKVDIQEEHLGGIWMQHLMHMHGAKLLVVFKIKEKVGLKHAEFRLTKGGHLSRILEEAGLGVVCY